MAEAGAERVSGRSSGLLFVLAIGLAAMVYWLEFQDPPEPGIVDSGKEELFPELEAQDVEWVELTTLDGRRLRAERDVPGWVIVGAHPGPADSVAFEAAASQLASLRIEGSVDPPIRLEDFGLEDSVIPLRFGARGRTHQLRWGQATPIGGNTYVRIEDEPGVDWVASWRANALQKKEIGWRDRRVLDFDRMAVRRVLVRWPGGGATLVRQGDEWQLTDPLIESADPSTVEGLLTQLSFLEADGWVEEEARAEAEAVLEESVFHFELETDDGELPRQLALAPMEGGLEWVASGDGGHLVLIAANRLEDLPKALFDFRHKSLGGFDPSEARGLHWVFDSADSQQPNMALTAEWSGGQWRPSDERVDPEDLRGAVNALSTLQATEIVADGLGAKEREALRLAPGNLRVQVTGEGGQVLTELVFGRVRAGQGWWVSSTDSPTVYRVDEALAEVLPVDAADFQARWISSEASEPLSEAVDGDTWNASD